MKRKLFTLIGVLGTSLWSIANAGPVTYTYNFGNAPSGGLQGTSGMTAQQQGTSGNDGTVYIPGTPTGSTYAGFNPGGGAPTIQIYGENVPNGKIAGNPPDDGGPGLFGTNGSNGTMGLFEVSNNYDSNTASGIAPYVPGDNSQSLPHLDLQDGITENNVLLINLSNVAPGSTISFVMSTGIVADPGTGINVWEGTYSGAGTPTGLGTSGQGGGANGLGTEIIKGMSINSNPCGGWGQPSCGVVSGSISLFNTTTNVLGSNEWIAIQADCHYLLLTSLTITPSGVPEPSFYGFLALGMVGLVLGARKMRARAAVAAATSEKA